MLPSRGYGKLLLAALMALTVYLILTLPWPGVREAYRRGFKAAASAVLSRFGSDGYVRYEDITDKDRANAKFQPGQNDMVVVLERRTVTWHDVPQQDGRVKRLPRTEGAHLRVAIDSGRIGYVPTALTVALVLATPVPWARRWRALLGALVLVHLYVAFRLALLLAINYSTVPELRQFELGGLASRALALCYELLFVAPTGTVMPPAFIWGVATLRRPDIAGLTAAFRYQKPETE